MRIKQAREGRETEQFSRSTESSFFFQLIQRRPCDCEYGDRPATDVKRPRSLISRCSRNKVPAESKAREAKEGIAPAMCIFAAGLPLASARFFFRSSRSVCCQVRGLVGFYTVPALRSRAAAPDHERSSCEIECAGIRKVRSGVGSLESNCAAGISGYPTGST